MENSHNFTLNEAAAFSLMCSKSFFNSSIWCSNSMFLVVSFWVSKWTWFKHSLVGSTHTLPAMESEREGW
jgi:hypothetical protein